MILGILTLLTALAISGVAYYSIGLVAIFSASVIPIAVMGVVLETNKLYHPHGYIIIGRKQMSYSNLSYFCCGCSHVYYFYGNIRFSFQHIEQTSVSADNTLQIGQSTTNFTTTKRH